MPFCRCNVPAGFLADDQKDDLAQAITPIHAEVTAAPPDLVHVIYNELAPAGSESTHWRATPTLHPWN